MSTDTSIQDALSTEFFEPSSNTCLAQGDILYTQVLSDQIRELGGGNLAESVYPYFFANYKLCVVLNATCDLVTGGGRKKKVDCVQLVALSPLSATLEQFVKRYADKGHEFKLIDDRAYSNLTDDFRRIVDGQHKTRYFLPEIPGIPFDSPWTARLDVIVSIRYEHPAAFMAAQTGHKIRDQRASKLAENTSALFNRIALDDVRDVLEDAAVYKNWIEKHLICFCRPISSSVFSKIIPLLQSACRGMEGLERDQKIVEIIEKHRHESKTPLVESVLAFIEQQAKKHLGNDSAASQFMAKIDRDALNKLLLKK